MLYRNEKAVEILIKAAQKTVKDNSWIVIPKDSAWLILNALLNVVSEFFATGYLAEDLGLPVKSEVIHVFFKNLIS